jgi:hypothetical protein
LCEIDANTLFDIYGVTGYDDDTFCDSVFEERTSDGFFGADDGLRRRRRLRRARHAAQGGVHRFLCASFFVGGGSDGGSVGEYCGDGDVGAQRSTSCADVHDDDRLQNMHAGRTDAAAGAPRMGRCACSSLLLMSHMDGLLLNQS